MKSEFLRTVQRSGWTVETASETACIGRCGDCGVRVEMPASDVPVKRTVATQAGTAVSDFDAARRLLKSRRRELLLTIAEVEVAAGFAGDHLAKLERDNGNRMPSASLFIHWANALGFDVVLRPAPMPAITLSAIAGSRAMSLMREANQRREDQGRGIGPAVMG